MLHSWRKSELQIGSEDINPRKNTQEKMFETRNQMDFSIHFFLLTRSCRDKSNSGNFNRFKKKKSKSGSVYFLFS